MCCLERAPTSRACFCTCRPETAVKNTFYAAARRFQRRGIGMDDIRHVSSPASELDRSDEAAPETSSPPKASPRASSTQLIKRKASKSGSSVKSKGSPRAGKSRCLSVESDGPEPLELQPPALPPPAATNESIMYARVRSVSEPLSAPARRGSLPVSPLRKEGSVSHFTDDLDDLLDDSMFTDGFIGSHIRVFDGFDPEIDDALDDEDDDDVSVDSSTEPTTPTDVRRGAARAALNVRRKSSPMVALSAAPSSLLHRRDSGAATTSVPSLLAQAIPADASLLSLSAAITSFAGSKPVSRVLESIPSDSTEPPSPSTRPTDTGAAASHTEFEFPEGIVTSFPHESSWEADLGTSLLSLQVGEGALSPSETRNYEAHHDFNVDSLDSIIGSMYK